MVREFSLTIGTGAMLWLLAATTSAQVIPTTAQWRGGSGVWEEPGWALLPPPIPPAEIFFFPDNSSDRSFLVFTSLSAGGSNSRIRLNTSVDITSLTVFASDTVEVDGAASSLTIDLGLGAGFVTNDGTILIDSGGEMSGSDLGVLTLDGGGSILLTDDDSTFSAGELFNNSSHRVRGYGTVSGILLDNGGNISADRAGEELKLTSTTIENDGSLIASQAGELLVDSSSLDNNGLVEARADSLLEINDVDSSNAAGEFMRAVGNSSLLLFDGGELENGGFVLADGPDSGVLFNNGAEVDNDGIIRSNNGGNVTLLNSELNNPGTVEAIDSNSRVFINNTPAAGGMYRADSGGIIRFDDSHVTGAMFDGDAVSGVHLAGHVRLDDLTTTPATITSALSGAMLDVRNTLTNDGLFRLEDNVRFENPVLLFVEGDGTIRMLGDDSVLHAPQSFVQQADHTIEGRGRITTTPDFTPINFRNRGLIDANITAEKLIHSTGGGTTTFNENGGMMRASDGGILEISGRIDQRDDTNAPGVIEALAGSEVQLLDAQIRGGAMRGLDGGIVRVTGFADFRLDTTHDGLHIVDTGAVLEVKDTIVNDGQFRVDGDGLVRSDVAVTFDGGGRLTLNHADAAFVSRVGGADINEAGHTIDGHGTVDLTHPGSPNLVNRGLIDANIPGGVLTVVSSDDRNAANLINRSTGTLRASNGGRLRLIERVTNENVVEVLDGSVIELSKGRIDGGVLQHAGSGLFEVIDTSKSSVINNVTSTAPIVVRSGAMLDTAGLIVNNGTITFEDGASSEILGGDGLSNVTEWLGSGEVVLAGPTAGVVGFQNTLGPRVLSNQTDHTIRGEGELALSGLNNFGTINADVPGGVLTIRRQPGNGGYNNRGLARASNGGTLELLTLRANGNGVLEAGADSTVVLDAINVNDGIVRALAPQAGQTRAGLYRFANDAELRDLAIQGPFTVAESDVMLVGDDIDNTQGQITLLDSARLRAAATPTLTGGSIDARDQSLIAPVNAFFHDMQINVHDSARLLLNGADVFDTTITNTTGAVNFASPSSQNEAGLTRVTLNGPATITDLGNVFIQFNDRVTINGSLQLNRVSGDDDNLRRIDVADGTMVDGTGEIVLFDDRTSIRGRGSSDVFTFGAGLTVRGGGDVGEHRGGYVNHGTFIADNPDEPLRFSASKPGVTNRGLIQAVDGATLLMRNGTQAGQDLITNEGLIEAVGAGSRIRIAGAPRVFGGTFAGRDGGEIVIDGNPRLFGVTLDGPSRIGNGEAPRFFDALTNHGTLTMRSNTTRTQLRIFTDMIIGGTGQIVLGSLANDADDEIRPAGDVVMITHGASHTIRGGGQVLTNRSGMLNLGSLIADDDQPMDIDPANDGLINQGLMHAMSSPGFIIRNGRFTTSGRVIVDPGSIIDRAGVFQQTAGVTTVHGEIDASNGYALQGGLLEGNGTITTDVTQSGGTIAPGASIGELTIDGDLDHIDGVLSFELQGTPTGVAHDVLNVTGDLPRGGLLELDILLPTEVIDTAPPVTLLTAANLTGSFANAPPGELFTTADGRGTFRVHYGPTSPFDPDHLVLGQGSIIPEPSTAAMLLFACLVVWRR